MRWKHSYFLCGRRFFLRNRGFSLIEVVLALAIVGFSLVGVLSIFPVALETAKDSKNETRIALIAQNIFSDLQTSPETAAEVVTDEKSSATDSEVDTLALATADQIYLAYDAEGQAITSIPVDKFNNYSGDAMFLVSIVSTRLGLQAGLAQVNVSIQTPPQVKSTSLSRKKYYFSALVPYQ